MSRNHNGLESQKVDGIIKMKIQLYIYKVPKEVFFKFHINYTLNGTLSDIMKTIKNN